MSGKNRRKETKPVPCPGPSPDLCRPQRVIKTFSVDIISTPIVPPAAAAAAWGALPPALEGLTPRPLAVCSTPTDAAGEKTLDGMLRACGVTPDGFHRLILGPDDVLPWAQMRAALSPKHVLLLGVPPAALAIGAHLPRFGAEDFGGALFITAPSLTELSAAPDARRRLWEGILKPVFVGA